MSSHPPAPAPGPPQTAPQPPVPYVGSRISLISKSAIRYVGTLYTIDTKASTVALKDVRSYGTEGRPREGGPVDPSDRVYSFIVFRGPDILDLQFLSNQPPSPPHPPLDAPPPPPAHPLPPQIPVSPMQQHPPPPLPEKHPAPRPQHPPSRAADPAGPPASAAVADTAATDKKPHDPSPQPLRPQLRGPTPRAWGPPPAAPSREVLAPQRAQPNGPPVPNGRANGPMLYAQAAGPAGARPDAILNAPAQPNGRANPSARPRGRNRGRSASRQPGASTAGWRRGPGITIPEEDFDFVSMHEKFDKASLAESFAASEGRVGASQASGGFVGNEGEANGGFPQVAVRYDKSKSFFDELVPEKALRGSERSNAAQRRAADFETFGETVPGYHHRNGYRNRGGRRGRGRGRGRGSRMNATGGRVAAGRQEAR